jgi:hypothetical protein
MERKADPKSISWRESANLHLHRGLRKSFVPVRVSHQRSIPGLLILESKKLSLCGQPVSLLQEPVLKSSVLNIQWTGRDLTAKLQMNRLKFGKCQITLEDSMENTSMYRKGNKPERSQHHVTVGFGITRILTNYIQKSFQPLYSLVENMVEKNRNCFPNAVLLTTLICGH